MREERSGVFRGIVACKVQKSGCSIVYSGQVTDGEQESQASRSVFHSPEKEESAEWSLEGVKHALSLLRWQRWKINL